MTAPISFHALRFNRSASAYESHAEIQSRMAERLVGLSQDLNPGNILEFGCGTGILTRRLLQRFPKIPLLATDAAPAMLDEARKRTGARSSDSLKFAEQDAGGSMKISSQVSSESPYDLLASNALVQWFSNLENHFRFAAQLVNPNGAYLVSGFMRSNFPELNSILAEPPFSYQTFPGQDSESIRKAASAASWKVEMIQEWEEVELLPSAMEVLHRIQALGSTRDPKEGGRLNRKNLHDLITEYEQRFSQPEGVRLTWKPWAALLKRDDYALDSFSSLSK